MTWSQTFVVSWTQFSIAAALLLWAVRWALTRCPQPVDRIRLIQVALAAAVALPVLLAIAPWQLVRLEIPAASNTTPRSDAFSTVIVEPGRLSYPHRVGAPTGEQMLDDHAKSVTTTPPSRTAISPSWKRPNLWNSAAALILLAHGSAVLFFAWECAFGRRRLRAIVRFSAPASPSVRQEWDAITQRQAGHVRLVVSTAVDTPFTYGVLQPMVVIPSQITTADTSTLRYCLAHEWCHIQRHDIHVWHGVWVCQFLLWHLPSFWSLRRELRICQDLIADDHSTPNPESALAYSELLMGFARNRQSALLADTLTMLDHPSQLTRRITMLLTRPFPLRSRSSWRLSFAAILAAALAINLMCGVRLDTARVTGQEPPAITAPKVSHTVSEPAALPENPPAILKFPSIVLDQETGQGIANANVSVTGWLPGQPAIPFQQPTGSRRSSYTTAADGTYTFEIPPGQLSRPQLLITVKVEHGDYVPFSELTSASTLIKILNNEAHGARPVFERIRLQSAASVTGRVLTPDGSPLVGVKIKGFTRLKAKDYTPIKWLETRSAADGSFRLSLVKKGIATLWVLPDDYAIYERVLDEEAGDIGDIRLSAGTRISGQVLAADGKPAAGIYVDANRGNKNGYESLHGVGSGIRRSAKTDTEGRFAIDPLPPGDYRVESGQTGGERLPSSRDLFAGVFTGETVTLVEGITVPQLELRALPDISFRAQYLTSQGEKIAGHRFQVSGTMDGQFWTTSTEPNKEGTVTRVPRGLQNVHIMLTSSDESAFRFRAGQGKPLVNWTSTIELGDLNDDFDGFEIIRYKAPIVFIRAVDEAGQPIKAFQAAASTIQGERRWGIQFEQLEDGRQRSTSMLPDEETTFTIQAEGYAPTSQTLKLAEAETKELALTLKRIAPANE